jgi:ubiquinol-cytochrome c reductase cytochrome b subunit
MWGSVARWIEVRIGFDDLITQFFRRNIMPRSAGFLSTLGFVALIAFFIQVVTGILLLLYYIPHPDHAFESVQTITNTIPFGWLFRTIHIVGSNILVAVIIIHVIHSFFRSSYKYPRELTWLSGGFMFFLVLFGCVSGQLLPWNQSGYWSTTVASSMPSFLPIIGEQLGTFLKGGASHVFLVRRQGLSTSPQHDAKLITPPSDTFQKVVPPQGIPCFPQFSLKRLFMVLIYVSILFAVMAFLPDMFKSEGANIKANPLLTPEFIRPSWYFLAPYQLIKSIPNEIFGLALQLIFISVFLFWPFLDALEEERNIFKRPILLTGVFITLFVWLLLTYWGMQ